jgi:hypothetical protein
MKTYNSYTKTTGSLRVQVKSTNKATNLLFVNIFCVFNVVTFIFAFLEAKLSDMISIGKLFEKSRIVEKVFYNGTNDVMTRQ